MSFGLGSDANGRPVTYVACSNDRAAGMDRGKCTMAAQLVCAQPNWVTDNRRPNFDAASNTYTSKLGFNGLWGRVPGYDILNLPMNEGMAMGMYQNFKLCFSGASDLRNLIRTVNCLPKGYQGRCDILFNDPDAISANRNLLILYILVSAGPSIDEAAELALHLMYSSRLTATSAAYVQRCVHLIYGDSTRQTDMTFQRSFTTRGKGMLYSAQPAMAIKRPLEMFLSRYELPKAMRRMRDVLLDPGRIDDRQKVLANLEPAHRLAHVHFWKTGVLAPFSMDLTPFSLPNRLSFTPQGSWLGRPDDVSPLQGWDISRAQRVGQHYGLDPSGDIFGCLFFHIKYELQEFIHRIKSFHITIHHTSYDSRLLSKGISVGVLPSFTDASFDRIDLGAMPDKLSLSDCLNDWAPLMRKNNAHSCLVMSFTRWSDEHGSSLARVPLSSPETILQILKRRCRNIPSLGPRLKKLLEQGLHSPSMIRLIESLDVFVDSGPAFQEYLQSQDVIGISRALGIRQRRRNRIHSKRLGLSLEASPGQVLPDITRQEYYNLFNLARGDLLTRFVEFEFLLD
ncbi:hypothetical protein CC1G_05724 [Coprinopsis cinerea okayama7|uniref:DUF4470 domain-containing protein n=1 Tax=Coprinopsis cinerea (strain Okayama-7 / 130 / ATCC MYA-4618 / FGSC 9003) TaxID=240176 RepID=A8N9Z7_COPC7|nr:hypothetical protein CC1G_05724 [Coprinopsis cinerea okayama7\|eukprot:XP_001831653.1 hypothetical protein CC1G_05724 [Coprinopsis cinerea okayama7\